MHKSANLSVRTRMLISFAITIVLTILVVAIAVVDASSVQRSYESVLSGPVAERYGVALWFLITGIASCLCTALGLAALARLGARRQND